MSYMKYIPKIIVGLLFLWLVFLVHRLGWDERITIENIQRQLDHLHAYVESHYLVSVSLFMVIFFLGAVFFLPITSALTIVSGNLFGIFIGALYSLLAATSASVVILFLVRYVFGNTLQKKYPNRLKNINEEIDKNGAWYIFAIQLLPFSPAPLINIAAGLSKLSSIRFSYATALGILPGTLLYTYVGNQFLNLQTWRQFIIFIGVIALTVGGFAVFGWFLQKKMKLFKD